MSGEQDPKGLSHEEEALLKSCRIQFTGLIDDFRAHLLDTSRPPHPNLRNGFAEWKEFGFDSLAVEAATRCGKKLFLTISARDPAAALRGLERYRQKWELSIRNWFGCAVQINFQYDQPNKEGMHANRRD